MDERGVPKTSTHLLLLRKKYRTNYREMHSSQWYSENGASVISCSQCGFSGRADACFYRVRAYPRGYDYKCKKCKEEIVARDRRKRWYGVSDEAYQRMLRAQSSRCAICGDLMSATRCCVDHNHENGRVRALLCSACNLGLGNFMESPERMLKAIAYLELHSAPEALAA